MCGVVDLHLVIAGLEWQQAVRTLVRDLFSGSVECVEVRIGSGHDLHATLSGRNVGARR